MLCIGDLLSCLTTWKILDPCGGCFSSVLHSFVHFLKLYFIDYAITVVPIFPCLTPANHYPQLSQSVPTPLFMYMSHA